MFLFLLFHLTIVMKLSVLFALFSINFEHCITLIRINNHTIDAKELFSPLFVGLLRFSLAFVVVVVVVFIVIFVLSSCAGKVNLTSQERIGGCQQYEHVKQMI
jgi:hypothetical protein